MLSQQEEVEAEVRQEDQLKINEFGKNNAKLCDVRDELMAMKRDLEMYDDASTDLMMGEGEPVQLMISQTFMECSEEFAGEYIEKMVEQTNENIEKLTVEEEELDTRQAALKKVLYARFGSSINLEA